MKRIFSKDTYNGYHIVTLSDEPNTGLLLAKKSGEKDEYGFLANEEDIPRCPHSGEVSSRFRPWAEFILVPSLCQKCIWLYRTPHSEFNCILLTKDKRIITGALVNGGE
ncbi:hypothetical protein ES705_43166 [subsurface metagenome]